MSEPTRLWLCQKWRMWSEVGHGCDKGSALGSHDPGSEGCGWVQVVPEGFIVIRRDEAPGFPIKFYPVVNDLIGGWDVSEHNKSVADHDYEKGERTIGSFMSKEWATRVADALNRDVQRIVDALASVQEASTNQYQSDTGLVVEEADK